MAAFKFRFMIMHQFVERLNLNNECICMSTKSFLYIK